MAEAAVAPGTDAEEDIDVDDVNETDQVMSLAEQQDATMADINGKGTTASAPARTPTNNLEEEGRSLENLRIEVESKGGVFEPGWTVEVLVRQTGNSIGTKDTYYFSPTGKRYRSRQEVVRVMGLAAAEKKSSREQAYNTAQQALSEADLPRDLACGATLRSWGSIDQRPHFSTPTQLHPVGLCATWPECDGALFISRIVAQGEHPRYTVALQLHPDAAEKLVAEGSSANEAWTRAAERQKQCIAMAIAREKALVPGAFRRSPSTPKASIPSAKAVSPSARASKDTLNAATSPAAGSEQQGAVVQARTSDAAPLKPAAGGELLILPDSPQPMPNGTGSSPTPPVPLDGSSKSATPGAPKTGFKVVLKQVGTDANSAPATSPAAVAGSSDSAPVVPPELTKVEKRLRKAESLAGVWGAERFGLTDTTVLLALEGLPGVDTLKKYEFVERRPGGWQAEISRLEKEQSRFAKLAEKGAKGVAKGKGLLVKQQEKRKRAEEKATQPIKKGPSKTGTLKGWLTGGTSASDAKSPSKAGRPMPHMSLPASGSSPQTADSPAVRSAKRRKIAAQPAVSKEVQGVVTRLLKAVELRVEKAAERDAKKAARAAEKLAKARDKDANRNEATGTQAAEAKTLVQQSLRPVANLAPQPVYPVEDSTLPGARLPAPAPEPLPPKGLLPPPAFSAVLSELELLCRYREDLEIDKLPSLEDAEAAVAGPASRPQDALNLHYAFVANVVNELWEAACTVEENADRSDFKRKDVELAFPPLTPESWPEAARRVFQLQELAAMVKALDSSGGLGPAIGNPGNSSSHPLALMDSATVLQTLLAGCPSEADCHVAALPHTAVPAAPAGLLAMQDARALSSCEHLLRTVGVEADEAASEQRGENALMIAGRRMLWKLINESHGRAMCSDAMKAATAARFSAPLDLRIIAARLDEGVYGTGEEGLRRMAADVKYACALWRVGCGRPKPCGFARSQGEKRALQVQSQVYESLGPALEEGLRQLAEGVDPSKPLLPNGNAAASPAVPGPEGKDAIVSDLDRPFVPWAACGSCWSNDDHKHLLICDETGAEMHTYCISPPLDDVPNGSWCSPRYLERSGLPRDSQGGLRWRTSGFEDHIQLCRLLSNVDYADLTAQQRAAVLNNLAAGLLDTSMMRQVIDGDLDKRKALSEELRTLQRRLKQEEEERKRRAREEREAKAARELAAQQASIAAAVAAVKGPKAAAAKPAAALPDARPAEASAAPKAAKDSPAEDPNRRQPPPRGTRATTADAARPLENTVSARDLDMIKTLEYDIEELIERGVLLGMDRHWSRYWLLSAPRIRARQVADRVPIVCVERQGKQATESATLPLLSPNKVKTVGADFPMTSATWGCYSTPATLDPLLQWLNPKGVREKELRRRLQTIRRDMAQKAPAAPSKEPVTNVEADARTPHPTDPPAPTGASSLPAIELPAMVTAHLPLNSTPQASATESKEQHTAAAQVVSNGHNEISPAQAATESPAEPHEQSREAPRVSALREAIFAARRALPEAAVDAAVRATPQRQSQWQRLVTHASDAQAFMAAVVVLEGFIRREYLKPWWRLWAFPTPSPDDTSTLAAVWMRLQALQSAVKSKLGVRESAAIASPITAKISLRNIVSARNAAAALEEDGSGNDTDIATGDRRTQRLAAGGARRKAAAVDEDEAMALRLHEEMNGPGDSGGGSRRRNLRVRAQPAAKRAREARNNSASDLRSNSGYRSKLRRTATDSRPNYSLSHAARDDDDDDAMATADEQQQQQQHPDDVKGGRTAAQPATGGSIRSSDSGGHSADSDVQLSDLMGEEEEEANGRGEEDMSETSQEDASSEQDSEGSPEKPVGRRTGRRTTARDTWQPTGRVTRSTAR